MKQFFCNPLNFSYRYQFNQTTGGFTLNREAADPSVALLPLEIVQQGPVEVALDGNAVRHAALDALQGGSDERSRGNTTCSPA